MSSVLFKREKIGNRTLESQWDKHKGFILLEFIAGSPTKILTYHNEIELKKGFNSKSRRLRKKLRYLITHGGKSR